MDVVCWVQENDRLRLRREKVRFGSQTREYYRSLQDIVVWGTIRLVLACERIDVIYDCVDSALGGMSASDTNRSEYHVWTHVETTSGGQ